MGEKITRPVSTDLARARFLKEALQRGTPALSHPQDRSLDPAEPLDAISKGPEERRAYFEELVECAPAAVSILDTECRIRRVNSEFTRMFGFSPAEATGRSIDSLIVPPDRSSEARWIGEVLMNGKNLKLETKRQRKDGTLVDVVLSGAPVVVSGRQIAAYIFHRDISDQKRAEALNSALYQIAEKTGSAEDLQQFYSSMHAILGKLMYARNLYIALYDPLTQLLTFPYYVDEENATAWPQRLGRGLTEYVLRTSEPLLCTPEMLDLLVERGEVERTDRRPLDWLGVPLKRANRTFGILAVQSYSSSIRFGEAEKEILSFISRQLAIAVEHKEHEETLRRSESRYRSLVQSAVYGICRSSLDGKFLDVNPALIAMLGYFSAEEVLALDPKRDVFVDSEEQARLMNQLQRAARLDNMEVRWRRKDGNTITVRLSGRAVTISEHSERVLELIAEDITERRMLEDQFRQAQKMEAVGRLAGGVAHDFNNLLMVISGYTEVLLEHAAKDDFLGPKVAAIQQAADRATGLTRQLLTFSRKQLLELKVVDINAIVKDIERLLRPLIGENIELATRLSTGLGRTRADAGQIEQVIMNLVVNAKDAMPAGGKITIQTANVRLDDPPRREYGHIQPGSYVMLSIGDTGHGMDKETQARIFEPFFTTKEKGKGTGLGLSTVYGIVKQTGGHVFVQSELHRGTTFRIYFPRVEEDTQPTGSALSSGSGAIGTETVLLVEDEESVRQLVRETLELKGYKILEADNGEAALRIASTHPGTIDMLITDVVMPGMSGRELAKQLATSHPQTRTLFLSGYAEDAIVHHGVLDPGTAFLQKPFTLQSLANKVREVLGTNQTNRQ
jgi:two-component system, cell cycle sensor histidine kinase and response regulator CckA